MLGPFHVRSYSVEEKKGKIGFKSMLSLLIGMMETSLIQVASAFHNKIFEMPCPAIVTLLPATHDSKLPHPGCTQHEPPPLQPTFGVSGWVLQPTQNPGGWKTTMVIPKWVILY